MSIYGLWADENPEPVDQRLEEDRNWILLQELVAEGIATQVSRGLSDEQAKTVIWNKIGCSLTFWLWLINPDNDQCPNDCRSFIVALATEVSNWPA